MQNNKDADSTLSAMRDKMTDLKPFSVSFTDTSVILGSGDRVGTSVMINDSEIYR